jgi:N-acetylglucosaminyl-diphospho-decaprenol L-rhamnosyltransferase
VRVSVIIATWNAADVLDPCLASVAAQKVEGGFETIVVDNASSDHTREVLAAHGDRIRVIANDHNARFAGANNQASAEARGDVLFFLNSDTELLAPDVLERLAQSVESDGVGLVGPLLLNPDGSVQPSCAGHPTIGRSLLVASGLHRLAPGRLLARAAPEFWSHDHPIDTGWLMGAAIATRADLFRELGGFWSTMYAEDQDFAYRVQKRGLRVRFEPSAKVMHVGNHSLSQRWSSAERAERVARAELEFLRTHRGRLARAAIRAIVGTGYALRALAHALLGRESAAAVYRAMARVYWSRARP